MTSHVVNDFNVRWLFVISKYYDVTAFQINRQIYEKLVFLSSQKYVKSLDPRVFVPAGLHTNKQSEHVMR